MCNVNTLGGPVTVNVWSMYFKFSYGLWPELVNLMNSLTVNHDLSTPVSYFKCAAHTWGNVGDG